MEKDYELFKLLKLKYADIKNIEIINIDAIKYKYDHFNKIKIISNLPYNLSTKIIFKLLSECNNIDFMTLMIQKEFAEKIDTNNNLKKNKYNFFIDVTAKYKIQFTLSNKVFYPKPKVKSCIVTIKPKKINNLSKINLLLYSKKIFSNKRKKIKNIISIPLKDKKIISLLNQRAEDLKTQELIYLFNKFQIF